MKKLIFLVLMMLTVNSFAELRFSSCKDARSKGYSHIRRGQPGYSSRLDRDGDGIACDKKR